MNEANKKTEIYNTRFFRLFKHDAAFSLAFPARTVYFIGLLKKSELFPEERTWHTTLMKNL